MGSLDITWSIMENFFLCMLCPARLKCSPYLMFYSSCNLHVGRYVHVILDVFFQCIVSCSYLNHILVGKLYSYLHMRPFFLLSTKMHFFVVLASNNLAYFDTAASQTFTTLLYYLLYSLLSIRGNLCPDS